MNAARLRAARKQRGLTQVQLADKVGVTQSLIGQYERGLKRPAIDRLQALAAALGITVPWLLGEQGGATIDRYSRHKEPLDGPAAIIDDVEASPGLRELAARPELHDSLRITNAEWRALHSLDPPGDLSMDGYLSVLLAIRAAVRT